MMNSGKSDIHIAPPARRASSSRNDDGPNAAGPSRPATTRLPSNHIHDGQTPRQSQVQWTSTVNTSTDHSHGQSQTSPRKSSLRRRPSTCAQGNTAEKPPTSRRQTFDLSTTQQKTPRAQASRSKRPRANSLHHPRAPTVAVQNNFYLPHYSTDRQYSLKPTEKADAKGKDKEKEKEINLELGLGQDFDYSFGEALRRGVGGREMPLPQEALRVLTEAKDNLDMRVLGKQGRKGSMGLGLFKESRAAAQAAAGEDKLKKKKVIESEVVEEAVELEDTGTILLHDRARSRSTTSTTLPVAPAVAPPVATGSIASTFKRPATPDSQPSTPPRPPRSLPITVPSSRHSTTSQVSQQRYHADYTLGSPISRSRSIQRDQPESTLAGIQIISSPLLRERSRRTDFSNESPHTAPLHDEHAQNDVDDPAMWSNTSTPSTSFTSLTSSSASSSSDDDAEGEGDQGEEESSGEDGHARSRAIGDESQDEATDVDDVQEEEGEHMTVPLQPFNHAVGGHSSIYKFTRRAVCKVSDDLP